MTFGMGGVDRFFNLNIPEIVIAGILHGQMPKSTVDHVPLQRINAVTAKIQVIPGIVNRAGCVRAMRVAFLRRLTDQTRVKRHLWLKRREQRHSLPARG